MPSHKKRRSAQLSEQGNDEKHPAKEQVEISSIYSRNIATVERTAYGAPIASSGTHHHRMR